MSNLLSSEYPVIKTVEETKQMLDEVLAKKEKEKNEALERQRIENNENRKRAIEIIEKAMNADYERYRKKKRQWSIANNFLDYAETFTGVGFSIVAIIVGFVTLNPLASGIIVGANAGITTLLVTLRKSIFNREYNKFSKKLKNVNTYKNRMWLVYEHIKQDNEITPEELKEYSDLYEEYKSKKNEKQIEDKPDEMSSFDRILTERADAQAKQIYAQEKLEIETQKKLDFYRSRSSTQNLQNVPSSIKIQ